MSQSVKITTDSLASGIVGVAYSQTLTATGGDPKTWSIKSGALPGGLTLNANSGVISGRPTTPGTANFTVKVTRGSGSDEQDLSITVHAALTITTTLPAATVGVAYSQSLNVAGGVPPYNGSLVSGSLPAGLSLSGTMVSGTPTAVGNSTFTVRVTDSGGQSIQQSLSIRVDPPPLSITTTSLPPATIGTAYSQGIAVTGGTLPYSWSIASGNLPGGLTLSSSTGVISGAPTASTTANFTVSVADNSNPRQTAQRAMALTVLSQLTITTPSPLAAGTVGVSYSQTLTPAGGTPSYTWSLASGSLPAGITLASSGTLSGTPSDAGSFTFTVRMADSSSPQQTTQKAFDLTIGSPLSITTQSPLPTGLVGSIYSQAFGATGGTLPYTWTTTAGQLPPGVTLSGTGQLSGTPTTEGNYNVTVRVSDGATPPRSLTKTFDVHMDAAANGLRITTPTLPTGIQGFAYNQQLQATGGPTPYTWAVQTGPLPSGLTLTPGGLLQGTPVATGSANLRIRITDATGINATRDFTLSVGPSLGSLSLTGVQSAVDPVQQLPLTLSLSTAYSMPVSGTLNIAFAPSGAVLADDPTLQFSSGGRSVGFTFPANGTTAVFPSTLLLMTGSVSGTVTITASIQNGPSGLSLAGAAVRSLAPQFTSIVATRVTGGLRVQIVGYSPERRVTNAEFGFDVRLTSGTQRVSVPKSVESDFSTWYRSSTSIPFGSSFLFDQLFGVQGDTSSIEAVTVTLTNSQGSTSSSRVPISAN